MNRRTLLKAGAAAAAVGLVASARETRGMGLGVRAQSFADGRPQTIQTRDGAALFFRSWGSGTPVLFVHSWAVNLDLWQYQMFELASKGLRCLAYDRRGHGRSSDPGQGYDFDTLANDLATVIDTLGLRDVTLVGHSMGCGEIVRYLTRHGREKVNRVVLLSPTLPFMLKTSDNPDGIPPAVVQQLRAALSTDLPGWLAANARPFFVTATSSAMVDWGVRMFLQTSLQAVIESNRANLETDFRAELPRVAVPTLVIHGDADVSAPIDQTGRRTAALIPGSQLKVYRGAPHGLMFTHVRQLNADLHSFITG